MSAKLQNLTEQLLSAAKTAGAEAADALAVDGTSLSISVREGALEEAERAEGIDIGLRVLIGQRQACVSASDTSRCRRLCFRRWFCSAANHRHPGHHGWQLSQT